MYWIHPQKSFQRVYPWKVTETQKETTLQGTNISQPALSMIFWLSLSVGYVIVAFPYHSHKKLLKIWEYYGSPAYHKGDRSPHVLGSPWKSPFDPWSIPLVFHCQAEEAMFKMSWRKTRTPMTWWCYAWDSICDPPGSLGFWGYLGSNMHDYFSQIEWHVSGWPA